MAVSRCVDTQNHPRVVYMKFLLIAAKKSTPGLRYMCTKTLKGYPKCQNIEDIADKNALTIECHEPWKNQESEARRE